MLLLAVPIAANISDVARAIFVSCILLPYIAYTAILRPSPTMWKNVIALAVYAVSNLAFLARPMALSGSAQVLFTVMVLVFSVTVVGLGVAGFLVDIKVHPNIQLMHVRCLARRLGVKPGPEGGEQRGGDGRAREKMHN